MKITTSPGPGRRREHRKRAKAGLGDRILAWCSPDSGLVFTITVGTPLDASRGRRDFRAPQENAGIEGVWAPRELRHAFVSVMSESAVAVNKIARLTRHSSSRMTQTIYRHEFRPVIPPAPTSSTRYSFARLLPYAVYHRIGTLSHECFWRKLTVFALLTLRMELKCAYPH